MVHNLVLTSLGLAWGFGYNGYHQLLLPSDIRYQTTPTLLPIENIIAASVGNSHSLFLDCNGYVFSAGDNYCDQLGLTDSEFANRNLQIPTLISSIHNIISISAGFYHSLFLDSNGKVFSCGCNRYGQLGLGHAQDPSVPTLIPNLENIVSISAGCRHSVCLDDEGKVWSFGSNDDGQLGLNDNIDRLKPERVEYLPIIQIISATRTVSYTMMLDYNGVVWVCGHNYLGRLGLGDELNRNKPTEIKNLPKIISTSAGQHSMMLDENGEVWTCGSNLSGELGLNDKMYRNVPTKVQLDFKVSEIQAGYGTTMMIDDEGILWVCGSNESGRLGLGDIEEALVPTRIGGIEGEAHLEKMQERKRIASAESYV